MNREPLNVTILGRDYRLTCVPEERDALLAAVAYVDERMHAIRDANKISGTDRIAVLAALNIANELLTHRPQSGATTEVAFNEFKRRIQSIDAVLDTALAPQEKLF